MPSIPSTERTGYTYQHHSAVLSEVQSAYSEGRFCRQTILDSLANIVDHPTLDINPRTTDGDWFCGIAFLVQKTCADLLFPWQSPLDKPDDPCSTVRMYCTEPLSDRLANTVLRKIARQLQASRPYSSSM